MSRYPRTPKSLSEATTHSAKLLNQKALPLGTEPKPTEKFPTVKGGLEKFPHPNDPRHLWKKFKGAAK